MNIVYKNEIPVADQYFELFLTTGWNDEYKFTKVELEEAIRNSWYLVAAYSENKLVGFGRIISDGIHHALIVDVIVHPEYQGKGIGKEIMNRLIAKCNEHKIRDVQLFSAKDKSTFYERLGFYIRHDDAPGMQLKNIE
jgi:N-acetylglutamate synthase-like GNAT family acetyltransferase